MNVRQIIEKFLCENGHDGLFNADGECGCELSDLFPCGSPATECEAGYKVLCTEGCNHDGYEPDDPDCWHIQCEKPESK